MKNHFKMFRLCFAFIIFAVFSQLGMAQIAVPGTGVTDVDGNSYETVLINNQEWMAENLKTAHYSNGDSIPNIVSNLDWVNSTNGAWCYYENQSLFVNPYGKMYNYFAVTDSRNVCPTGWKVPTDQEWKDLINFLDTNANGGLAPNVAGSMMKDTGTLQLVTGFWNTPNDDATNESLFSSIGGGLRTSNGLFDFMGDFCYFWSSSEVSTTHALFFILNYNTPSVFRSNYSKYYGMSVRCKKDPSASMPEIKLQDKKLIRILNWMGEEVKSNTNGVLFYQYSDGSIEKRVILK